MINDRNLSLSDMEELLQPADRITIYRTLQTFVKKGIAHQIDTVDNKAIYALCAEGCDDVHHTDNHPHFYCEKCMKVICSEDFSYSINRLNDKPYQVKKVEVNLRGICPECKEKD